VSLIENKEFGSVRVLPDPVLRTVSLPVQPGSDASDLISAMRREMSRLGGVGIAAPQIGFSLRIFIISYEGFNLNVLNPTISKEAGSEVSSEGCLSIPGKFYEVKRHSRLTLAGFDTSWRHFEVDLSGFLARIAQHEMDHLEGVTIDARSGGALSV
jgi:peptide deformylase